jgi:anti-sigma regulatory factor (Ser/Thr protein kinase)
LEASKVSRSDAFAVILASAEAFANAVEHPHHASVDEVTIEGSVSDDCVTIWIRDYGTWRSDQSQKEHGGLGLAIIEALMDAVRVDRAPEGTTISMRRRLALSTRT